MDNSISIFQPLAVISYNYTVIVNICKKRAGDFTTQRTADEYLVLYNIDL